MTKPKHLTPPSAANLLHARGQALSKGDPVALPLVQSSMYHLPGDTDGPGYGRSDNATWEAVEHLLGQLEDAPCLLFPSGMAAISAALFACVSAGDRVLLPADGYYTTRLLAEKFLTRLGVKIETRPTATIAQGGFDGFHVVLAETPSNPGLDVIDLADLSQSVRAAGGTTIVDNTMMTPFGQRPLDLGVDIVVASDTKAPGGHSDLLMGHLATRNTNLMEDATAWRKLSGAIPGPAEAWLLHRGLETLELRFDRMCTTAEAIAPRLAAHKNVRALRYPGLPDDPAHAMAKSQMIRFGFILQLTLVNQDAAERFINTCPLLQPATSFGGVHSSAERRARWGDDVDPGSVRLAVGCEPTDELWAALEHALDQL